MKKIIVIVFAFLYTSQVLGQKGDAVYFHFESDSINVIQGKTFTNFIIIENAASHEITVESLIPEFDYAGLLLAPDLNFILPAGESKRMPVKFIAHSDFLKMDLQTINFSINYKINNRKEEQTTSFYLKRKEEKSIALYAFSPENYLDPNLPESAVSFFVENKGFSKRQIKLIFESNPHGLQITPQEMIVSLEGMEKKLVEFKVSFRRQTVFFPDYMITVKAQDFFSQESLSTTYIKTVILSHNRQVMPGIASDRYQNSVELTYNQFNDHFRYAQLKGNTAFVAGNNLQTRFNTTMDYFMEQNAFNLYDTWLEFEKNKSNLRLGNIYGEGYDYAVTGRGAKMNYQFNNKNAVELLAADNNYNLFGNYYPEIEGSKIIAAKYNFESHDNVNNKISYIFDHNPREATNTHMMSLSSSFTLDSIHRFNVEGGISSEEGFIKKDQYFGTSLGVNYEINLRKWNISSLNSYSSAHYTGQKRGSFMSNQRISYSISKEKMIFGRYQNTLIEPQYLSFQNPENFSGVILDYPPYYYQMQTFETGIQFYGKKLNVLLSPQFVSQENMTNAISDHLRSYRFKIDAGTFFSLHNLNFSSDYGYSKAESQDDWFHNLRLTLSYRYKGFSLNAITQVNPYDVMDFNRFYSQNKKFNNSSLYSSYTFQSPGNNWRGSVSAGINYSELYRNINQNISGSLEYKFSPTWSATGYANYSKYKSTAENGFQGNNTQVRIGFKKYFLNPTSPDNHKVNIQLFYDENFNGILDASEQVIPQGIVKLDNFIAVTDKKGKVSFQNVPSGIYKIKINDQVGVGLKSNYDEVIIVEKNQNLKIGLIKEKKVSGKLMEIKQKYDIRESEVSGIIVYAKNEAGNIYSTVVNQDNYFEFFLKDGIYEISIENNRYQFLNPSIKINIRNGEFADELIFEYKKKDTEIKVKKF